MIYAMAYELNFNRTVHCMKFFVTLQRFFNNYELKFSLMHLRQLNEIIIIKKITKNDQSKIKKKSKIPNKSL